MTINPHRRQEPPRPPFYKSSTLIPYHLQVIQFNGTTIRDRSAGERARAYLIRRSLSLKKRVVKKNDISAPIVPRIDSIHSQPSTVASTIAEMDVEQVRSESRQALLKRARTPSRSNTAQSKHKHQKTSVSLSHSLQTAAAEDPRLQTFAGSDPGLTALPLALRSGDSARNSRLLAKDAKASRTNTLKRVASKAKLTAKTTAARLGKVFYHKRSCRRLTGRPRPRSEPTLEKIPIALDASAAPRPRPKSTQPSLQCIRTPEAVSKAQERLYQPTQRSCSAWEIDILGTMLKRAFRYGHTDFSDLRPIGRLLARCSGTLSFRLEKTYPSGCKVLQRMYAGNGGREDDMANLIPPLGAPALIARPEAAATTSGSTSWFIVGIEGPSFKGKPGLRSQIKLGIADEVIGHYQVGGLAPDFRVCCLSPKQVENTEQALRQSERQLGIPATTSVEIRVQSVAKYDRGSVEMLNDLLSMYTER